MTKLSLSERLERYIKNRPGEWVASGDIQRIVSEKTKYTASNATRRLRELAEDGTLEVEYRKGHSFYRAVKPQYERRREVVVVDGVAKEMYVTKKNV